MRDRAQLSLSVVEAGVGVVLVLAVVAGLALGVPAPNENAAQLEAYASDTASVLAQEPPRHQGSTRLAEITISPAAFARERGALDRRVDALLSDNLLYQVETPHGTVGFPVPSTTTVGAATVTTPYGDVAVRVWYG